MHSTTHTLVRRAAWSLVGGQGVHGLGLGQALLALLRELTWLTHQRDQLRRELEELREGVYDLHHRQN